MITIKGYLSIKNAVKSFKDLNAVNKVSLDVNEGEFLTILGPSGSGKTTLLKLIAGFENLDSGIIYLNQQEINKKKPFERNIGMVFQNYALFPHLNVSENIAYPLKIRKWSKQQITEKVKEMLSLIDLEPFGNRYPKQLSGGQQQRVALARAIVFSPPLLLLDESLSALDKSLRQQMQLEVKEIQKRLGITTISVTHDQEEALTMSDRVCVMNSGGIEQVDTPENLYRKPINKFVAQFIGEINILAGSVIGTENGTMKIKVNNDKTLINELNDVDVNNSKIHVAIRPEDIEIVNGKTEYDNVLNATVSDSIYTGGTLKLKVTVFNNDEITVNVEPSLLNSIKIGEELLLGWNSNDGYLLN